MKFEGKTRNRVRERTLEYLERHRYGDARRIAVALDCAERNVNVAFNQLKNDDKIYVAAWSRPHGNAGDWRRVMAPKIYPHQVDHPKPVSLVKRK